MIVTDARKRLKAQMLRDQQVVVKEHQAAKELHKHLCDINQLEEDVLKKQEEIEANLLEQSIYETSIEEILKEQSKLDVEIIRLSQKLRLINKPKSSEDSKSSPQPDSVKIVDSGDEKIHFNKTSKQALLRRITGIVLDDRASDQTTIGFGVTSDDIRSFEISHVDKEPDQIEDELWQEVAANSTHFDEFQQLFSQGQVMVAVKDEIFE